jgi:hypothetical protein
MGCLSLLTANVMFVNNTMYFLLLIFSGANVDLNILPGWMQVISNVLPLTRGIASARALIAGASLTDILPLLAQELGIGLFYGLLGYFLFKWVEISAKRRGTLETI